MRITILWSGLASYTIAFFRELASRGCRIQLIYQPVNSQAPYAKFDLSFCEIAVEDQVGDRSSLDERIRAFSPDCILMASWNFIHFVRAARLARQRGVYVVSSMDNQWAGTSKQYLGIATSRFFLHPAIDTFLVAGDRQARFAKKLGYDEVLYGYYAGEVDKFRCEIEICKRPRSFLFIGRLVAVKGIQELRDAYALYRNTVEDPWDLTIVGAGDFSPFENMDGVKRIGFVQPNDLPSLTAQAQCFILPSLWEPWGVVVHEAAAAGLPIIASYQCGSTTMFVRDGVNGYIIAPRPKSIAEAMIKISSATASELSEMSKISGQLANLWTPQRLGSYFLDAIKWKVQRR